ncbi:hypothetical protein DFH08DRAFT_245252 [Mycena albidolilacea]|uniref:Uncharacterized protein n=1 Tax=Mycena albidolilacea TaxID=1033008 RepID=A0AAD6ZW38_9AGAR|nr:hypothetical protein DFH08DRAFT_245252 [Mycena albidolilacea]
MKYTCWVSGSPLYRDDDNRGREDLCPMRLERSELESVSELELSDGSSGQPIDFAEDIGAARKAFSKKFWAANCPGVVPRGMCVSRAVGAGDSCLGSRRVDAEDPSLCGECTLAMSGSFPAPCPICSLLILFSTKATISSAVGPDLTPLALFAAWSRTGVCFVGCGRGATGRATAIGSSALFAAFGNSAGVSAFLAFEFFESSQDDCVFGEGILNGERT